MGSFHVVGVSIVCVAGNKATELAFLSMYQYCLGLLLWGRAPKILLGLRHYSSPAGV